MLAVHLAADMDAVQSLDGNAVRALEQGEQQPLTITRADFDHAVDVLRESGFPIERDLDEAWELFRVARARYEFAALQICRRLDVTPAPWSGTRRIPTPTDLAHARLRRPPRHREGRRRRARAGGGHVIDLAIVVTTFALILPAELPDKTFIATLVLATRFRRLWVWLGVAAAFFVQVLIAVTAGGLLALLPQRLVLGITFVLFAVGAVIMIKGGLASRAQEQAEEADEEAEIASRADEQHPTSALGSSRPASSSSSPRSGATSASC